MSTPPGAELKGEPETIPVSLLTGFLGSGKTTLLNRLLGRPDMGETAVLINEFGEIGLDHLLVQKVDDAVVLLNSGCLCCTVRGDLADALRDLFIKRYKGEIPKFQRVLIETTGLADPAPILHALIMDPVLANMYRLDGVITTVDAVNGARQLDANRESVKQAAVADRIVVTKSDIADATTIGALTARLDALNPAAPKLTARHGDLAPAALFGAGLFDPDLKIPDVKRWLNAEAYAADGHRNGDDHGHRHEHDHGEGGRTRLDVNRHDDHIRAFCMTVDRPIVWNAFVGWLDALLVDHAERLLRIKGILNVEGEERPVAIHGVHHVFHPPVPLPAWDGPDRRSRIVVIARDLDRELVEGSLRAYQAAGA
jgi:G3E family GTPase